MKLLTRRSGNSASRPLARFVRTVLWTHATFSLIFKEIAHHIYLQGEAKHATMLMYIYLFTCLAGTLRKTLLRN